MQTHDVTKLAARPIGANRQFKPPVAAHYFRNFLFAYSPYNYGRGVIAGKVTEQAVPTDLPVMRKVWLCDKQTGSVMRQQWSNAAGEYFFKNIDQSKTYYVIAFDHTGTYNAVIRDNIVPVVP